MRLLAHDIWRVVLECAEQAAKQGEVPVGAVVVHEDAIIARAHNQVEAQKNTSAHAEMLVLRAASEVLGNKFLTECDLYVSLEPCAMCAGAIAHSRIRRLYFGAYDAKAGAVDNGIRLFHHATCHHRPEVYGGMYESACAALLQDFFKQRRGG